MFKSFRPCLVVFAGIGVASTLCSCSNRADQPSDHSPAMRVTEISQPDVSSTNPMNSSERKAGVFLHRDYVEGSSYTDDDDSRSLKYVFDDDSADCYELLSSNQFVLRCGGKERLVELKEVETNATLLQCQTDATAQIEQVKPVSASDDGTMTYFDKSDIESAAVAKPGDWYCILKSAPTNYSDKAVQIDWSACSPGSACQDLGANADPDVFDVTSGGFVLHSGPTDTTIVLKH